MRLGRSKWPLGSVGTPFCEFPIDFRKTILKGNRLVLGCVQLATTMKLRLFSFNALMVCMMVGAGVQTSAQEWSCIQVNDDGTAQLNWAPDQTGADAYSVTPMLPAPDFTPLPAFDVSMELGNPLSNVVGNLTPLLTTTQGFCYTLTALDGAGSNLAGPSDTLCTIFLELELGLLPGSVDFSWNSPFHFNPPVGFSGTYTIQQLLPDASWLDVVSAPWLMGNSNTTLPITQCDGTATYRVTLTEDGGCTHQSNMASIAVADVVDPTPPQIVAVDVDSLTGLASVSWEPSPESDVAGYIVYICTGSIENILTTIEDPNQLSYTYPMSGAGGTIEYYNVAAFDSCYIAGMPDPGAASPACAPSTYLEVSWTQCTDRADLQWSPVYHWPGGVDRYEVWASELDMDGVENAPVLLAEVPGTLTYYEHVGANVGSLYRYRVVAHAVGTDWTQSSNVAENLFTYPGGPEWMRWTEVSIVTDSIAVLRAEVDASSNEPHTYELWRNEPFDDDFEFVTSAWSLGGALQMRDSTIEGGLGQYRYYLKVVNACGDSVLGTPVAETVFLTGTALESQVSNALAWTGFEGWDAPRTRHVVLRGIQYGGVLEELEDFGPSRFSYTDELEALIESPGEFCYRVRTEQEDSSWASISNEVCLTLPPVIWIPNALVHNGINNTWKPFLAFADVEEYRVDVFSRWGDSIWTTTNPEEAWDGTKDGVKLPEAFYPYTLRIQDGAGRLVTRMGHVMVVLRP